MRANKAPEPMQDFQEPGVKKVKRIAAVVYIFVIAFIVGGSIYHQRQSKLNFQHLDDAAQLNSSATLAGE